MSETTTVLHGIAAPEDRWDESLAAGRGGVDRLVYRSNLLGADRALANVGGGNTSAKETIADHTGREVRVLWVKGSGTDLATITSTGFAGLRLDELLPLRNRDAMPDAEMVEYLLRCGIRPDQPRPSIETLLHAFVRADHVDHTHPDAIIALTSAPDGRRLAEDAFGDEAVWLDYQRPGFDMSRRIAELLDGAAGGPRGPAGAARPGHLGRDRRGELPQHASSSSAARPRRSSTRRRLDSASADDRSRSRERPMRLPCCRCPSPHSAERSPPTPTASSSRSTAARRRSRSPPRRGRPRSARSARRAPTT